MRPFLPLILSSLFLAGCNGEEQKAQRAAPLVTAGPIAKATFTDTVEAVGTALANEQVVLSAPVTERIESVKFADGGFVKRGQVIATMAVAQEKAELAAAQAQAQQASQQLQRIQALKARGFATAASLAQPTPASTSTGTFAPSTISRIVTRFWMPSPDPIGAPSGIIATAPASSNCFAAIGSSVQ